MQMQTNAICIYAYIYTLYIITSLVIICNNELLPDTYFLFSKANCPAMITDTLSSLTFTAAKAQMSLQSFLQAHFVRI